MFTPQIQIYRNVSLIITPHQSSAPSRCSPSPRVRLDKRFLKHASMLFGCGRLPSLRCAAQGLQIWYGAIWISCQAKSVLPIWVSRKLPTQIWTVWLVNPFYIPVNANVTCVSLLGKPLYVNDWRVIGFGRRVGMEWRADWLAS